MKSKKAKTCGTCGEPIPPQTDHIMRSRKAVCAACQAAPPAKPSPKAGMPLADDENTGRGPSVDSSIDNFLSLIPDDLHPRTLAEDCKLIPDRVLAAAMAGLSGGLSANKSVYDKGSDQWLTFPDQAQITKCSELLLAYAMGQPIKRIITEEVSGPSEEDMLEKVLLNDRTMEIYSLYGVYAGAELEKLVATCGGDPKKIPAPRRRFQRS